MTFCPDWLIGSPNLNTSNWLYLWVYLVVCLSFITNVDVDATSCPLTVHEYYVSQVPLSIDPV